MLLLRPFQWRWRGDGFVDDFDDLSAADELVSAAAAAGGFVAAGVQPLFAAHAGLHRERVAITGGGDGGDETVGLFELDEQHALAGAAEEVDLIRLGDDHAPALAGGDNRFLAAHDRRHCYFL